MLKIKSATKTVVSKKPVDIIKVSGDEAAAFYEVCDLATKQVALDPASAPDGALRFLEAVKAGWAAPQRAQ